MIKKRCSWVGNDALYISYHDHEWGNPIYDDQSLFEALILETFQSGLSWITILRKRENFRNAFSQFKPREVALYDQHKVNLLLKNKGIIRHELKIRSAISNARAFLNIQEEFGSFNAYIWGFVKRKPIQNKEDSLKNIPVKTELSKKISIDLKNRGFKFVGPTVVYSFIQAVGLVNDHLVSCYRHSDLSKINNEANFLN